MDKKLYIITSYFNPHQFKSRKRLYKNFAKHMADSGATLMTVEAVFGQHPFEVTNPDDEHHVQLRTNQILWHKERLLNIGIQRLVQIAPESNLLAGIDADVTFSNPDWVGESIHRLMHHPFIQLFGVAVNLDANEHYMWHCPSSFREFIEGRGFHQEPPIPHYTFKGHPGLAWGFTRKALDGVGGLYDLCAAGSGDTVMANCLKGAWDSYLPANPSPGMVSSIRKWAARADAVVKGNLGYTRGTLLHHWHGHSEQRGYEKRWSILSFHQFDPVEDLLAESSGLYRWAGNKPRLEDDIRLSLSSRNEDAT